MMNWCKFYIVDHIYCKTLNLTMKIYQLLDHIRLWTYINLSNQLEMNLSINKNLLLKKKNFLYIWVYALSAFKAITLKTLWKTNWTVNNVSLFFGLYAINIFCNCSLKLIGCKIRREFHSIVSTWWPNSGICDISTLLR